jgi:hypothetical protein
MKAFPVARSEARLLVPAVMFIALVVAAVASLGTPGPGHLFPDNSAYTTAALVGIGAMTITTLTSLALARRRSSETNP